MPDLAGRTALVTGASRGLGPLIARALAERGANLVLAARSGDELEAVARSLRSTGGTAVGVSADVTSESGREALLETATAELGGIDVLVNNAGRERAYEFHRLTRDEIVAIVEVNLIAPMLLTHAVLPQMLERRFGHVVNISSLAAKGCPPYTEPYTATKAGLIAFTKSLRAAYRGTGVSASVVVPGFVADVGMFAAPRRPAR